MQYNYNTNKILQKLVECCQQSIGCERNTNTTGQLILNINKKAHNLAKTNRNV